MKSKTVNSEITDLIQSSGVEPQTEQSLKESFLPFFEQAQGWKEKAMALVVTSVDQKDEIKQAREARLAVKNIRVDVEKTRKSLKEDSLRKGKAIDGIANVIKYLIAPIEEHLQEQEDFVKIQEAKAKEQLKEDRLGALTPYDVDTQFLDLANMPQEVWENYLSGVKSAHAAKIEAEAKAEKERIENERLDKQESERRFELAPFAQFNEGNQDLRNMSNADYSKLLSGLKAAKSEYEKEQAAIREENEKLRKEAEAEKLRQEKADAERKAKEEKERKEREEKAQKERKEQEDILRKEREEKAKIESELQAKKAAEEKSRVEAEKAQKEAALAPDKDKLKKLASDFESISFPELSTPEAKELLSKVEELRGKVVSYINEKAESL